MKFSKKKRCGDCKALVCGSCELGHKIMITRFSFGAPVSFSPHDKCYKPKTNSDLILARELIV